MSEVKLASICGISKVIYTLYIDAFPLYIADKSVVLSGIYDFIKFLHFVLKISATTISCITALSVQFIRHFAYI